MDSKIFNWGIIGPGRIAHAFAKALEVIESANLLAVASRSKERATEFAARYNAKKIYSSYSELTSDPEIDAIYIATPHRFHFEQALLAINEGKPVLCEKPMNVNSSETKTLIDTARSKNVFLMEALWTRYLPIYSTVNSWLKQNLIGDIQLLNSSFGFNFARDLEDRKFNHELAGGALLDLGVYNVAVSQWVTKSDPIKISANGCLGETNVDELLAVTLEYENGIISQFSCNFLAQTENDFLIYGSKGYIRIHSMFLGATEATLYIDGKETRETESFRSNGFEYQIEDAMHSIREGKLESKIMPLNQTLGNMNTMDKIRDIIGLKYNFE